MTSNQLNGVLRAVLPAIVAYFAAKGVIPLAAANEIGLAIITIVCAVWSWKSNEAPTA